MNKIDNMPYFDLKDIGDPMKDVQDSNLIYFKKKKFK